MERLAAPTRREFVAGAAAIATSAAVPEAAFAAASKARIAIVGAGIAGLNAALTLQDSGIASTVYEASNRIGGRMFSATSIWADNQVTEWCGELIDSDHETIIGLARRFGLPLDDFAGIPNLRDTYKILGRYYTVEQAYEDWRGGVQQAIAKDLETAGELTTYDKFTPEITSCSSLKRRCTLFSSLSATRRSFRNPRVNVTRKLYLFPMVKSASV